MNRKLVLALVALPVTLALVAQSGNASLRDRVRERIAKRFSD